MTRFSFALASRHRLFHAQFRCAWARGAPAEVAGRSWLHHSPLRQSAAAQTEDAKPADFDPLAFDPTERRSPPADKVLAIVEEIANLTLLEASDLSFLLKKKLGLPDHAMPYYGGSSLGMAASSSTQGGGGQTAQEEKEPEKTSFDVKLEKFEPAAKIKVIKEVRAYTDLGLKEAKEMVEKTPVVFKKGVSKEEAEQIIEKLKAAGATCVLE